MKYNFKEGALYKLRFNDHAVGIKHKMICECVGWVVKDESDYVILTHWQVVTNDKEVRSENIEPVSILKSCILKVRRYV